MNEDITTLIRSKKGQEILGSQHIIYSIGLTDYLPDRILKAFIAFAFSLLYPSGRLIVAHKDRDKYKPIPHDWFIDWVFQPRNVTDLIKVIKDSEIEDYSLDLDWEDTNKIFFLTITKMR